MTIIDGKSDTIIMIMLSHYTGGRRCLQMINNVSKLEVMKLSKEKQKRELVAKRMFHESASWQRTTATS